MKTTLAVSTASVALSLLLLAAPVTSRAQNLFVSNAANTNTIDEFNSSGVRTVFVASGLVNPTGLAFGSGGNLYLATNNEIDKLNSSGVRTYFAEF